MFSCDSHHSPRFLPRCHKLCTANRKNTPQTASPHTPLIRINNTNTSSLIASSHSIHRFTESSFATLSNHPMHANSTAATGQPIPKPVSLPPQSNRPPASPPTPPSPATVCSNHINSANSYKPWTHPSIKSFPAPSTAASRRYSPTSRPTASRRKSFWRRE